MNESIRHTFEFFFQIQVQKDVGKRKRPTISEAIFKQIHFIQDFSLKIGIK